MCYAPWLPLGLAPVRSLYEKAASVANPSAVPACIPPCIPSCSLPDDLLLRFVRSSCRHWYPLMEETAVESGAIDTQRATQAGRIMRGPDAGKGRDQCVVDERGVVELNEMEIERNLEWADDMELRREEAVEVEVDLERAVQRVQRMVEWRAGYALFRPHQLLALAASPLHSSSSLFLSAHQTCVLDNVVTEKMSIATTTTTTTTSSSSSPPGPTASTRLSPPLLMRKPNALEREAPHPQPPPSFSSPPSSLAFWHHTDIAGRPCLVLHAGAAASRVPASERESFVRYVGEWQPLAGGAAIWGHLQWGLVGLLRPCLT